MLVQLLDHKLGLLRLEVLERALQDAAAVRVSGKLKHLTGDGIDNESETSRVDAFKHSLDDMVAMRRLDAIDDVSVKLGDKDRLLVRENVLESFLNDLYVSKSPGCYDIPCSHRYDSRDPRRDHT